MPKVSVIKGSRHFVIQKNYTKMKCKKTCKKINKITIKHLINVTNEKERFNELSSIHFTIHQ